MRKFCGMVSFSNSPDYIIKYNDIAKSIEFRVHEDFILAIVNSSRVYNIYKENDVKELLQILNIKLKGESIYTEIDINKIFEPPKIYINNIHEATLISHIWNGEKENILVTDVNINAQELLKDKEFVSSSFGPIISTNNNITNTNLTMLPRAAKITYAIHKGKDIILTKEAEKMVNGSYYLDNPNIKGEYIYVVILTFTDMPNIEAVYYFKYVL